MGEQLPLSLQLPTTARFSSFVAGPNAELVAALARSARGEDEALIYCWGSRGCGRTHLLQASCHAAACAGRSPVYLPLGNHEVLRPELLEGWEQFDLVCVDDVDAVAGIHAWEEALFHLYNRSRDAGASLIVSAATAPGAVDFVLADLRSRLGSGVVYQCRPLDDAQRTEALQLRARQKGCDMPLETAAYLLRRLPRDLPALFTMLDCLDDASLSAQRRLTVPFVKSVLGL
jgi:DnaA family protein